MNPEVRADIEDRQAACDVEVWNVIEAFTWDGGIGSDGICSGITGRQASEGIPADSAWTYEEIDESISRLARHDNIAYHMIENEKGWEVMMFYAVSPPMEVVA